MDNVLFYGNWSPEEIKVVREAIDLFETRSQAPPVEMAFGSPWLCSYYHNDRQNNECEHIYTATRWSLPRAIVARSAVELATCIRHLFID